MSRSDAGAGSIRGAGGFLTTDLNAIAANYRTLSERLGPGVECGAAVKADAYGLGLAPVTQALWTAGCRSFFVALTEEGLKLKSLLPKAAVHIFNGVDAETAPETATAGLIPVLNHPGQIEAWAAQARAQEAPLPAMIQVETGMLRLGLSAVEVEDLAAHPDRGAGIEISTVMSHLACADDPDHPQNGAQLDNFRTALNVLRPLGIGRASLANSSAIYLDAAFHFDLARPGAALYGVNPQPRGPNPMAQVVHLQGKIIQTRTIDTPSAVGYGATHRTRRGDRIATVGIGYGDGYLRSLSNSACATVGGFRVPVVGRVSMDLITIDVTDVPEDATRPGALVDLIGPDHPLDELAREAGTIGYEILTALGRRYERRYIGGGPAS